MEVVADVVEPADFEGEAFVVVIGPESGYSVVSLISVPTPAWDGGRFVKIRTVERPEV